MGYLLTLIDEYHKPLWSASYCKPALGQLTLVVLYKF